MCSKIAYTSARQARNAAMKYALKDMRKRGFGRVNTVYRCPDCGTWHRTSKR